MHRRIVDFHNAVLSPALLSSSQRILADRFRRSLIAADIHMHSRVHDRGHYHFQNRQIPSRDLRRLGYDHAGYGASRGPHTGHEYGIMDLPQPCLWRWDRHSLPRAFHRRSSLFELQ